MRSIFVPALIMLGSACAGAAVVNVEFKFTPFTGDPVKANEVEMVPGKARVFVNNVLFAEQDVRTGKAMVMFDDREVSPAVWVPTASLGPIIRKGKNTIRIEFTPADPKLAYRAQLRWASVNDGESRKEEAGHGTATNQSAEGVDDKQATGKSVFEREFTADFAQDLAWHHYPPVTALTDQDKQQLAALAKARVDTFRPNFAAAYELLNSNAGLKVAEIKKEQCFEKAYAVGVRVSAPSVDQLEFAISGNPEVAVTRKAGAALFGAIDEKAFERIQNQDAQMCAAVAVSIAYPARIVVVRTPAGVWQTVY